MSPRRLVVEADGGSRGNPGPGGYGAVVRDADTGAVLAERAAGLGRVTNNVAEYGGLIAGLTAALELDPAEIEVRMDSKLVVEQMSGRWRVKHPAMQPLAREAAALVRRAPRVTFRWIPRANNAHADRLANEAMDAAARGEVWGPDAAEVWLSEHEPSASLDSAAAPVGWRLPGVATATLLLRHGQTALSVDRRFSGSGADPSLTPVGRDQAAAAAARLRGSGAVAVVTSPLRRARETADAVCSLLEAELVVEDDLRETDFGEWEGSTFAEVGQRWPDELAAWLSDPAVAPPGGESFAAVTERVQGVRDRLLSRYAGEELVVVSHVTPIKTLIRLALDAPPAALYRIHLDLASLSEVHWFSDGPSVVRSLNDTGHLDTAPR